MLPRHRNGVSSLGFLALSWLLAASVGAQEFIVPRGPAVQIDASCTYAPLAFELDGQVVVVWYRSSGPSGIWARRGPSLGALGPATLLADSSVAQRLQVAVQPGSFVLAWNTGGNLSNAFFQRFDFDLEPLAPAVDLGPATVRTTPALLADADGEVTIGFFDEAMQYHLRRFAADDTPLTPVLVADAAIGGGMFEPSGHLAASENGFLAAWTGSGKIGLPGIQVRAFGWDGTPLGPTSEIAGASLGTATYFDAAWALDSYLVAEPGFKAHFIAADGTPQGQNTFLPWNRPVSSLLLAQRGDQLWMGAVEHWNRGILGARITLPEGTPAGPVEVLVPWPEGEYEFIDLKGLTATAGGFLAAWQFGANSAILPPPCLDGQAVYAQEFGPAATVDVPAASATGLATLAALLAAAGAALALLRRG